MSVIKLGQKFELKYKLASTPDHDEFLIRQQLASLYTWLEKYNILIGIAESDMKNINKKVPVQVSAFAGYSFIKKLVDNINILRKDDANLSLDQIRDLVKENVKLIDENKNVKVDPRGNEVVSFPSVSDAVLFKLPLKNTKNSQTEREVQFQKVSQGLERINSVNLTILKMLQDLQNRAPEKFSEIVDKEELPERFEGETKIISEHEIMRFIRSYGPQYGINSPDEWRFAIENDEKLKRELTVVFNALKGGHVPKDSQSVKSQLSRILSEYRRRHQTNEEALETGMMPAREIDPEEIAAQQEAEKKKQILQMKKDQEFVMRQQEQNQKDKDWEIEKDRAHHIRSDSSNLWINQLLKRYTHENF
jgi:hypothetical protein